MGEQAAGGPWHVALLDRHLEALVGSAFGQTTTRPNRRALGDLRDKLLRLTDLLVDLDAADGTERAIDLEAVVLSERLYAHGACDAAEVKRELLPDLLALLVGPDSISPPWLARFDVPASPGEPAGW